MNNIKYNYRMYIYIEENRNVILIQDKWKYNWLTTVIPF